MKKNGVFVLVFIAAVFPQLFRCSLDPDQRLNEAIEQYVNKKPGAEQGLENEFIKNISIDSVKGKNLQSNGTIIYALNENEAEIIYPLKRAVSLTDGEGIKQVDISDNYIVIHDTIQFSIFDGEGDYRQEETVGDRKTPLRSLVINGDEIIYYKNSLLFRYRISNRSSELYLNDTFPPPYVSYYNVQLYKKNDLLCILTGIAGSYHFNIVNIATGSVILKNFKMSSSKHHMDTDTLFYISGSSGNWELMRYSVSSKTKKSIKKFNDIRDIELTARGCLWENSAGLWSSEYGKDSIHIPFRYLLAGTYKGRILLHYGERYYFIDMDKMFAVLARLKDKAPGLFDVKK